MLCQESGVQAGSEYFLNTVSESTEKLQYYLISCGHYCCELGYSIRREYEPSLILMYVKHGALNVESRGGNFNARTGDIIFMDCTSPHFYYTPNNLEFYWMHLSGVNSFDLCAYLTKNSVLFRTPNNQKIADIMYLLISQFRNRQSVSATSQSLSIYQMLCFLMPDMAAAAEVSHGDDPVGQAKKYIHEHIGEGLTLKEIAEHVNLSPSYFIRLFQKKMGYSPYEYVIAVRMDQAKYLLKTTDLSIKEIAFSTGYTSEPGFITAFSQKTGVPPGKFRSMPIG